MFCSKCGAPLPDGSRFCGKCGNPTATGSDASPAVDPAQSAAPFTPPQNIGSTYNTPERVDYGSDGTQVLSGLTYPDPRNSSDAGYDKSQTPPAPGYNPPQSFDAQPQYSRAHDFYGQQPAYPGANYGSVNTDYGNVPEKPKKKHTALKIVISVFAVLCLAAVGVGIYTDWFGLNGPLIQLSRATNALREDGNANFTTDIRLIAGGEQLNMNLQIDMNRDTQELAMLAEVRTSDSEKYYLGIYDDNIIVTRDDGNSYYSTFDTDIIWDELDRSEGKTLLELDADSLENMLKTANVYDEFTEYLDIDTFVSCMHTFASHMNNTQWLKENAGYSTSKEGDTRYYTYDLPIADFAKAVVDDFADAIIYQEDYDAILDSMDELDDFVGNFSCIFGFGVTDGVLSSIEFTVSEDGEKLGFEMEIDDVGSTKVDTDYLSSLLREAEPMN